MSKENTPVYAVQLLDRTHRVRMGLYPIPENAEDLATLMERLQAMPHTPEERSQIAARLLSALEGQEWCTEEVRQPLAQLKGEAEAVENPIDIDITAENYGLLYSAVQLAQGSLGPVVETVEKEVTVEKVVEKPVEKADPRLDALTQRFEAMQAELDQLKQAAAAPAEEVEETDAEPDEAAPEQPDPAEEVSEAEQRLQEAEDKAKRAVASAVALHMKSQRKPAARDRSHEELVRELMAKPLAVLEDRLEVLESEAGSPAPSLTEVPRLEDPTREEVTADIPDPARLAETIEATDDETVVLKEEPMVIDLLYAELLPDPAEL